MSAALALLPDFALILLGAALRRALHLGDHFWSGLEKLIYFVLFPALLFHGLVKAPIAWATALPLLAAVMVVMATGIALGLGARAFPISPLSFAAQYQCAFRFNSYIGLAVAGKLHGAPGLAAMAIVIGVMVPPANMAAVGMLARHGKTGVWSELARNPLILATVAGLTVNLVGIEVPKVALQALSRLGDAAVALGLLAVGAGLRFGAIAGRAARAVAAYLLSVKLIVLPVVALALTRLLALPALQADIAVTFAALPTASSAFILAQRMGGDGAPVAWLISASTLLAMLTLPCWLALR